MPPLKTVPLVQQRQAGKMLRCDCSERGWVAPDDAWAATGSVWGRGEGPRRPPKATPWEWLNSPRERGRAGRVSSGLLREL